MYVKAASVSIARHATNYLCFVHFFYVLRLYVEPVTLMCSPDTLRHGSCCDYGCF